MNGLVSCAVGVVVLGAAGPLVGAARGDVVELSPVADNTLYAVDGGLSNGAGQHFFAGTNSLVEPKRGLLRFDVASGLPADATIVGVSVVLHMNRSAGGPSLVAFHRVLTDWGEGSTDADGSEGGGGPATPGSATWTHAFHDDMPWGTPGGDLDPAAGAVLLVGDVGVYEWTSAALAADVQGWLDGTVAEFGWILIGEELGSSTAKRFDSRESPDSDLRPRLVVEFIPAPGGLVLTPAIAGIAAARRPRRRMER